MSAPLPDQLQAAATMTKYFAYGTNCNAAVMEKKGINYSARQRAVLTGYRLRFNKRSLRDSLPDIIGFANIEQDENGVVEGVLYDLAVDSLDKLDRSERYQDHYDRIRIAVEADSGKEQCWTYQALPEFVADGLVPSRNYINHILAGHEYLTQQYFDALDQSQVYRDACVCCEREAEVVFIRDGERLQTLCQSCREARLSWSEVVQRPLTVGETTAIMKELVIAGSGFSSIKELVDEAIKRGIITQ